MFAPRIVGFVCSWSLPPEIATSSSTGPYGTPKMQVVRVMCVGGIDPSAVIETLAQGADGVVIIGCSAPDCHYVQGNLQAELKIDALRKLLARTGLAPERLKLAWADSNKIESFAKIVDDFRTQIIGLGRSPLNCEEPDETVLLNVLAAKAAVSDFRLRALTGREHELLAAGNAYGEKLSTDEFGGLLEEVLEEELLRHRIHLLTQQRALSVKEIAVLARESPAAILRCIADMRRKGMITLDRIQATTPLYKALEVKQGD